MSKSHIDSPIGLDCIDLHLEPGDAPGFISFRLIPGRALMLLQAYARLPGGRVVEVLFAPEPEDAIKALDNGPQDFMGNASWLLSGSRVVALCGAVGGYLV